MHSSPLPRSQGDHNNNNTTPTHADEHELDDVPLLPGTFVVELHGLSRDHALSLADLIHGIVDDAARNLLDGRSAHLLAAYIMACQPRAGDDTNDDGTYLLSPDPACTVLCVAALRSRTLASWIAIYMKPVGEKIKMVTAKCTLSGCFARHARIESDGAIDRNEAGAGGCGTCARTWSGFHTLVKRQRPRESAMTSRHAALAAASLKAHQSLRLRGGIGEIMGIYASGIHNARSLMDPADPRIARALGALTALAAHVDAVLLVCAWASAFGVPQALLIVCDADASAGSALPDDSPLLYRPDEMLDCTVGVAVRMGLLVARARIAATEVIAKETGRDVATLDAPASFVKKWRTSRLAISTTDDMGHWARRVTEYLLRVRKSPTVVAATEARRAETSTATGPPTAPPRTDPKQQQQRQKDEPASRTCRVDLATSDAPRCADSDCCTPGRRITSGCVVTVACTAGCRVTYHRACWKTAAIVCIDHTRCPTSDCWGEIIEVTSVRLRASDAAPHILWRARNNHGKPTTSAPSLSPTPIDAADDRGVDRADHRVGDHYDTDPFVREKDPKDSGERILKDDIEDGPRVEDGEESRDVDKLGSDPLASPTTGGTPYHKTGTSHDGVPKRRKRPRARAGRPQRCRLAKQESDRLLALAGLVDSPTAGDAKTRPRDKARSGEVYADDTLWPPFFVDSVEKPL
ncbi:hypothetical protein pqer_cds_1140 [Pandoravirus quercus]|uniref:Uncharacterized protein n=2 Tax=Pandoravirus TaxID=2060084 RepID=A0A2U7UAY6_9VIRU|nr:hypothetical protein pqer_cds_1140 [Pandoravirus quercus]AVK75562.1 hypothetical protein pqer_cds_1140 [Pandoravirus quercus]QBZ81737.1 hypothetical protein pclt_cds_1155 [Pandoravirus celtis]